MAGLAVLDAAKVDRAVLLGVGWSAPSALWIAARYPDRVEAVILFNGFARLARDDGYPVGMPSNLIERFRDTITGTNPMPTETAGADVAFLAPSLADDVHFIRWWARSGQQAASPRVSYEYLSLLFSADVRDVLDEVRAPTLILQRWGNRFIRPPQGRYLASHLPESRYIEVDGDDHFLFAGDTESAIAEMEKFLDRALPTRSQ